MIKNFKSILMVNWKTGKTRVLTKKPKKSNPWEVAIKLNLDIEVPLQPEHEFKAKITVPETQVQEMVANSI